MADSADVGLIVESVEATETCNVDSGDTADASIELSDVVDHVYEVEKVVRHELDSYDAFVTGICALPTGNVVITDANNDKVKLLDKNYKVVDMCDIPKSPEDMCHIIDHEVAVAVREEDKRNEIHIIKAVKSEMCCVMVVKLHIECCYIAHNAGKFYVGSNDALWLYNLTGNLERKVYTGEMGRLAVSDNGERIYILNGYDGRVVTLDNTDKLLAVFEDSRLIEPAGIAVTDNGSVLACGYQSDTVVQIDKEGTRLVAAIVKPSNEFCAPYHLCFNRKTRELVVSYFGSFLHVLKLK